jgi:hypothetical protein
MGAEVVRCRNGEEGGAREYSLGTLARKLWEKWFSR